MSTSKSILKRLQKIEDDLADLKIDLKKSIKTETSSTKKQSCKKPTKPASITKCKSKSELAKFTVKELKDWVKENKIDAKKLAEKLKTELINLVWKNIKKSADSSDENSDTSDSGSSDSDDSDSSSLSDLD